MPTLKKLPTSLLQHEGVEVRSFSFSVRDDYLDRRGPISVKAAVDIAHSPETSRYNITLSLASSAARSDGAPYDFALVLSGNFTVKPGADEDRRERLIALNGPSILYGIARGYVASATSMAPASALQLPSVNLVAALG
jgi:preprotein translocase subunit SecB